MLMYCEGSDPALPQELKTVSQSEFQDTGIRERRAEISERAAVGDAVAGKVQLHGANIESRRIRQVEGLSAEPQCLALRQTPTFARR